LINRPAVGLHQPLLQLDGGPSRSLSESGCR
jgi:hypothetical protein